MDKMDKIYIYYVASGSRWWLVPANNVVDALEQANSVEILKGQAILTCRIATKAEIVQHEAGLEFESRMWVCAK